MMAAMFIVFALLCVASSYASPLRMASMYGSPLLVVPVAVQKLDDPQSPINEGSTYMLSDGSKVANDIVNPNIEKRSANDDAEEANDDDLATAAGTNVLRPLFVYRQQVAYRQRARDAIRRGRRI